MAWQVLKIPASHYVNSLRASFGRCTDSAYKQIGLRRLREASRIADSNKDRAFELIREADQMLSKAQASNARF